jgi:hypothetical protein
MVCMQVIGILGLYDMVRPDIDSSSDDDSSVAAGNVARSTDTAGLAVVERTDFLYEALAVVAFAAAAIAAAFALAAALALVAGTGMMAGDD